MIYIEIALLLIGKVCLVNRQPPPIQFSLQPSHSRIMSWALSPQSPDLSLEQFNISLQLLKKQRDLSALRLGPEKWLTQKVVWGSNKIWELCLHIWDKTERVQIEKWCCWSSPTGKGCWWKVLPLWGEVILSESLVGGGGPGVTGMGKLC